MLSALAPIQICSVLLTHSDFSHLRSTAPAHAGLCLRPSQWQRHRNTLQREQWTMSDNKDNEIESIVRILSTAKVIAIVGATNRETMPVYGVMKYLQEEGYKCIPINPKAAQRGESILGQQALATLEDIPEKVDLVDIFMRSDRIAPIFDDAIKVGVGAIWTQLGIRDEAATMKARQHGIDVIVSRCPAIEIPRLNIETPRRRRSERNEPGEEDGMNAMRSRL